MRELDKKSIEIIRNNADKIETSVAQFIGDCYREAGEDFSVWYEMNFALAAVMEKVYEGDFQKLVDDIIIKEGYFSLDDINRFNEECAKYGYYKNNHVLISNNFFPHLEQYYGVSLSGMKFTTASHCPKGNHTPVISGYFDVVDEVKYGCRGYVGVIVSRSVYPQASSSAMRDKHTALVLTDAKRISSGKFKQDLSGRIATSYTTNWSTHIRQYCKYDDPGLIYVDITDIEDNAGYQASKMDGDVKCETVLSAEICKKYNLPILD